MSVDSAPPKRLSLLQIGLLAARPKTLPAAATPVIVGTAIAHFTGHFQAGPALAALLGALFLQIGANYANDVYDFQRGADTHERVGPLRVTQAGLLTPAQVLIGMWIFFALAALMGIYLAFHAGWPVIAIGVFSILTAILYTAGPYPLGYNGLGELFVFLFFGLAAVCGTYYVQALELHPLAVWAAFPIGLLAAAILSVNNLRDLETDRASGKKTLAARYGLGWARAEFAAILGTAYLIPLFMSALRIAPPWILLSWGSILLAVPLTRMVYSERGARLNLALARTGQVELVFGLLFSLGLILANL